MKIKLIKNFKQSIVSLMGGQQIVIVAGEILEAEEVDNYYHSEENYLYIPKEYCEKYCEFVKGQRVLVSDNAVHWKRAYFSHFNYAFLCFIGGDEWLSEGHTIPYKYCKAAG